MINYPYISYCLYNKILDAGYETVYYICAGITSKLFLILVTCWLLRHLKFTFPVPNKQYSLVIITEVVILSIFGMISYDNVEVTASYSPVIICILLLITFILIIINGIYLNRIYTEKMQYEKQLQKRKNI